MTSASNWLHSGNDSLFGGGEGMTPLFFGGGGDDSLSGGEGDDVQLLRWQRRRQPLRRQRDRDVPFFYGGGGADSALMVATGMTVSFYRWQTRPTASPAAMGMTSASSVAAAPTASSETDGNDTYLLRWQRRRQPLRRQWK